MGLFDSPEQTKEMSSKNNQPSSGSTLLKKITLSKI